MNPRKHRSCRPAILATVAGLLACSPAPRGLGDGLLSLDTTAATETSATTQGGSSGSQADSSSTGSTTGATSDDSTSSGTGLDPACEIYADLESCADDDGCDLDGYCNDCGRCQSWGASYGPCDACEPWETPVELPGVPGCFCAPACQGGGVCTPSFNTREEPACVLGPPGEPPTLCALPCNPAPPELCPDGASCLVAQGEQGLCMHPPP